MKTFAILTAFVAALAVAGCSNSSGPAASAGPNGGDLVPIKSGTAYAELLANADTGAILVTTWDKDLKTRRPIEEKPITVGSGEKSLELLPHPMDTDPSGTCSRFYGEAEWIRGGGIRNGWMHGGGTGNHQEFAWQHAGRPVARPHVGGDGQAPRQGARTWSDASRRTSRKLNQSGKFAKRRKLVHEMSRKRS